MPHTPINYANTIIYKIVCKDLTITDLYVGHTTSFKDRKREHKNTCTKDIYKDHKLKVYIYIRERGGWDNWDMIEIEKFPCKDSNEARARERYWYEQLNATLNAVCPTLNVEKRKLRANETSRQYRINMTDIQKQEEKERCTKYKQTLFKCSCGVEIQYSSKSQHMNTKKHLNYNPEPERELI